MFCTSCISQGALAAQTAPLQTAKDLVLLGPGEQLAANSSQRTHRHKEEALSTVRPGLPSPSPRGGNPSPRGGNPRW